MLKNILNLDGAQELSKQQQKAVNGGKKCQTTAIINEPFGPYNGGVYSPQTCMVRCRPSFLGIGLGSWSESEPQPCG